MLTAVKAPLMNNFWNYCQINNTDLIIHTWWRCWITDTVLNFRIRALFDHTTPEYKDFPVTLTSTGPVRVLLSPLGPDASRSSHLVRADDRTRLSLRPPLPGTQSVSFDLQMLRCPAATNQTTRHLSSSLCSWLTGYGLDLVLILQTFTPQWRKHTRTSKHN